MVEILVPKKNLVMDSQVLTATMSCGRLADLRFNHNLVSNRGKSNPLEVGSLAHEILEAYLKSRRDGIPHSNAVDIGMAAGQTYYKVGDNGNGLSDTPINDDALVHTKDKRDTRITYARAMETMIQYFDFYKNDHWIPIDVEHVFQAVLYEDDECRILYKAKLDVRWDTNQGLFPGDHKTESRKKDKLSLNNQFMGQCILTKAKSVIVNSISWATSLKPDEKFRRKTITYSTDRLIEWHTEILPYWGKRLIEYMSSNYYPPNFDHCDKYYYGCGYKDICQSDRSERENVMKLHFIKGEPWDVENEDD